MIRAAAGLALLIMSLTLTAQNASSSGAPFGAAPPEMLTLQNGTTVVLPTAPDSAACPVSMEARQGIWDRAIRIREGDKERALQPFGQRISLNLKDSHSARIISAIVRVHGLNGKSGMLPTPTEAGQKWNAVRTLTVKFAGQADGSFSADLWISGFTSVSSVELLQVSYADGSGWRVSRSNLCRVTPDPFMLISNR
jgi:uncharacterized protein YraI